MDLIILSKAGADLVRGDYGSYSALDPVPVPDGNYMLPKRCLDDPDLTDAVTLMNDNTDSENAIEPIPALGEECVAGVLYISEGIDIEETGSNVVKCVQTHNRTEHDVKTIPALFTFFRENADDLEWIENEYVYVGWKRVYEGTTYEVIQEHMTLSTWTPDVTVALWTAEAGPVAVWVQPTGAQDAYNIGDQVYFPTIDDSIYESVIDANVWSPTAYPAGWTLV